MTEFNKDTGKILNYTKNDEGYLTLGVVTGVPDKILEYGDRKETITKDALTSKETLATLSGKPVTENHPNVAINASNRKKYEVGVFLNDTNINKDGLPVTSAIITDDAIIKKVEAGEITHVSMGYYSDKQLNSDGVYVQLNRNYNHGALLTKENAPRAGMESKLYLQNDSLELVDFDSNEEDEKEVNKDSNIIENKPNLQGLTESVQQEQNASGISDAKSPNKSPNRRPNIKDGQKTDTQTKSTNSSNTPQMDAKAIADKVELISEWKTVLEEEGISINYNADAKDIKKQILSCYYQPELMSQLNTDSIDGFWLSFVTEHYTKREQERQERRQINADSTNGINLDFDSYQQKLRQEYVKLLS